ncbi:MAG: DUF302 domain-containing protein [Bdellovibrionaceae bacterium]|nr:DUF302 domain-containing protein [Pseudobdellovibrionaceae bacterium]
MNDLAFKKEVLGTVEQICEKVIAAIQPIGFGVLTRIDFDQKIKEKLNETIGRTVVLGACNPKLALEAFKQSTDVALLIPCNIVVRELTHGKVIVEAVRPKKMLDLLKDVSGGALLETVERDLERVILSL